MYSTPERKAEIPSEYEKEDEDEEQAPIVQKVQTNTKNNKSSLHGNS